MPKPDTLVKPRVFLKVTFADDWLSKGRNSTKNLKLRIGSVATLLKGKMFEEEAPLE